MQCEDEDRGGDGVEVFCKFDMATDANFDEYRVHNRELPRCPTVNPATKTAKTTATAPTNVSCDAAPIIASNSTKITATPVKVEPGCAGISASPVAQPPSTGKKKRRPPPPAPSPNKNVGS